MLFIWYDLPSEKNIVITYTIIAEENISGMKKISGDFSFINENERKQLELPDLIFKVNPELIADQTVKENNSTTSSVRSIEKLEEDYIITVKTSIDNHKGFARIKEELPTNFTAEAIETAGSVFKNTDGYAKFIWANLPDSNSEIIIKYKISNNKGLDTNFTISGVYSSEKLISEGYNSGIEIPQTEYIPFKEISENLEIDSVTINTNKINVVEDINTSKDNEEITNEIIPEKVVKTNYVTEKTEVKELNEVNNKEVIKEEKVLENIISPKRANNNIDYKVQILAGHRIITNKQVYNQFNYQGEYSLETHNGWIKYTVGTNSEYIKARDSRNELNNFNFPGPFVTAYNYGERISVQEALILTSQNWGP